MDNDSESFQFGEQLKLLMMGRFHHDLRGHFQCLKSSLSMLRHILLNKKEDRRISRIFGDVVRRIAIMERLLSNARDIFDPTSIKNEENDLVKILAHSMETSKYRIAELGITVIINGYDISKDSKSIPQYKYFCRNSDLDTVFLNLLLNSISSFEICKKKRNKTIWVNFVNKNEEIEISFIDNGVGFPELYREKVFEPGFTFSRNSLGYGLAICRHIMENKYNGRICFESTRPKDVRLLMQLHISTGLTAKRNGP